MGLLGKIMLVMDFPSYPLCFSKTIQNSEIMRLSCSTKFLARTFFDASIIDFQIIPYDQYIALAMGALALAIKVSDSLPSLMKEESSLNS